MLRQKVVTGLIEIKHDAATKGQQIIPLLVLTSMNLPASPPPTAHSGFGETVRLPRESDGVGTALRQIFGGTTVLPSEFATLLNRLKDD